MRLKILVVEDDAMQADIAARMIEAEGYYVEIARTGRDAVRRICSGLFDVAVIDYRIPDIDGLSVVKVITAVTVPETRPVLIALTASPGELLERSGGAADFSAVCSKPISAQTLVSAIKDCVNARASRAPVPGAQASLRVAPTSGKVTSEPDVSGRERILIADDDEHLRQLLQQIFEAHGYQVDVATDGLEAVRLIGANCYDAAVIDYQMPELDGLAAAKVIYDQTSRKDRPRLIALTSTPEILMARDAQWRLVFDEIVPKNLGFAAILATVRKCLDYKMLRTDEPIAIIDLEAIARL